MADVRTVNHKENIDDVTALTSSRSSFPGLIGHAASPVKFLILAVWSVLGGAGLTLAPAVVGLTPPAFAHTDLVGSQPAAGATLAAAPTGLRLSFSDDVSPQFATVTLSVDGATAQGLSSRVDGSDVVADPPASAEGSDTEVWKVAYRVVSVDGHPITGTVTFSVTSTSPPTTAQPRNGPWSNGATPASPTPSAAEQEPSRTAATDNRTPRKGAWIMFAAGAALLMLAPAAMALHGVRQPQPNQVAATEPPEEPPADPPEPSADLPEEDPAPDPPKGELSTDPPQGSHGASRGR